MKAIVATTLTSSLCCRPTVGTNGSTNVAAGARSAAATHASASSIRAATSAWSPRASASRGREPSVPGGRAASHRSNVAVSLRHQINSSAVDSISRTASSVSPAASVWCTASDTRPCALYHPAARRCRPATCSGHSWPRRARSKSANRWW